MNTERFFRNVFIILVAIGLGLSCWLARAAFGIPWPEWLPH